MQFLVNGDFIFPLDWHLYMDKLLYFWSYQSGAANPDGIIRMPARLIYLLIFGLFGNLAYEYFYIISTLIIAFISFFIFSKHFLNINNLSARVASSLVFTFNPIFLGNISKLGLVLAAALLPLCLVVIKKAFENNNIGWLFILALLLNVSLLHPYTFTINLVISMVYLTIKTIDDRSLLLQNKLPLIGLGVVVLLLNAYFILPIKSMGTVNKDVLSSDASIPTDYTKLIDISNTGDILTGLSMSKHAFRDYDFYKPSFDAVYFVGVFLLYAVLLGGYLLNQRKLRSHYKIIFVVASAGLLILILLATVEFLSVGELIKKIVTLPGGWMFRSPLKWQLYIPFAICILLAISLAMLRTRKNKLIGYSCLVAGFILMNGYVGYEVFNKLLTPRTFSTFRTMLAINFKHKNLAYVTDFKCQKFTFENPRVMSELSQVFISNNMQVRQFNLDKSDEVNLSAYDYVLTCQSILNNNLTKAYDFKLVQTFEHNAFQLYQNQKTAPYAFAAKLVELRQKGGVDTAYNAVNEILPDDTVDFIQSAEKVQANADVRNVYKDLSHKQIADGQIIADVNGIEGHKTILHALNNSSNTYYWQEGSRIRISSVRQQGGLPLPAEGVRVGEAKSIIYEDPGFDYKNLIPNGSFENGGWQQRAAQCFSNRSGSEVGMSVTSSDKSDGLRALRLDAKSQIACTTTGEIKVEAGKHYLLGFDYKSSGGRVAGYNVAYDKEELSPGTERLDGEKVWHSEHETFYIPQGVQTVKITIYAFSAASEEVVSGSVVYDNFKLTAVPNIQEKYHIFTNRSVNSNGPSSIETKHRSPSKKSFDIKGATDDFFLVVKDSYSPHWAIDLSGIRFADSKHYSTVSNHNAWMINVSQICQDESVGCKRNDDGSYDFTLSMIFEPQKWFELGAVISGSTAVAVLTFITFKGWRRKKDAQAIIRFAHPRR